MEGLPLTYSIEQVTMDLEIVQRFQETERNINHDLPLQIIRSLRQLADESDKIGMNVKIANTVGNGVSIAGAIATIAGLVAAPFTAGFSTILCVGGTATAAAGGLTSVGAIMTSVATTNKTSKEAKALLEQLKASTAALAALLQEITEALTRLENNFFSLKYWKQVIENVLQNGGITEKELLKLMYSFLEQLPKSCQRDPRITNLPENIIKCVKGIKAYLAFLQNPVLAKQAQQLYSLSSAARSASELVGDVSRVSALFKGAPVALSALKRTLGGVFAGATIIFSIVNIVQIWTSGTETPTAAELRKIANSLEEYYGNDEPTQ